MQERIPRWPCLDFRDLLVAYNTVSIVTASGTIAMRISTVHRTHVSNGMPGLSTKVAQPNSQRSFQAHQYQRVCHHIPADIENSYTTIISRLRHTTDSFWNDRLH